MKLSWSPTAAEIFALGPVVPVLVIENIAHAVPVAEALLEGGIRTLEITLRTENALQVIETLANKCPDAVTGAGTVANAQQLQQAVNAGAQFMISPGLTDSLLQAATSQKVPLIPGISTLSELMLGMEYELDHFKFFPAEAVGGIAKLKSIAGPFPHIQFCPTGGIKPGNALDYLSLPNVACVGGSWLATRDMMNNEDWRGITRLAREIVEAVS